VQVRRATMRTEYGIRVDLPCTCGLRVRILGQQAAGNALVQAQRVVAVVSRHVARTPDVSSGHWTVRCERSSLLPPSLIAVRCFLRLNSPERRRLWLLDELSLRPSSELRLLRRSRAPSRESPGPSLLTDRAELLGLLDRALSVGAASDCSRLERPSEDVMLLLRPAVAIVGALSRLARLTCGRRASGQHSTYSITCGGGRCFGLVAGVIT
jgi:hypothetical protein